ncbi:MAG: NAD(P)/FAD-dependent oxidoreductase [Rubrivivax sp.]
MNHPLPERCDLLVIGAGPAGSACAQLLARAGLDVRLIDQHAFPRDKTCGDGLIPDSHAALTRLGVLDEVMRSAQPVSHVRCYAPSSRFVDVPGTLAVLPRRELDDILVRAAVAAGAHLHTPWRFDGLLHDGQGRVSGARLRRVGGERETVELQARQVILATGAPAQGLVAAELCERQSPSAIGLRGYVRHPGLPELQDKLQVVWHRKLKPGYGWIFPCGNQRWNIGVGIIDSHDAQAKGVMRNVNLRQVFKDFCELHPPARELMQNGQLEGELKGAPLRSSLVGATLSKPGVLVTGEAAGSTYSFTGEGIGKAMETGMLAAESVLAARQQGLDDHALASHYQQAIQRLKPKFDLYERGNRVNYHPWLTEILIRRAAKSARLRQRMSNLLEEKSTPAQLVTARGLFKLIFD